MSGVLPKIQKHGEGMGRAKSFVTLQTLRRPTVSRWIELVQSKVRGTAAAGGREWIKLGFSSGFLSVAPSHL